MSSVYKAAFGLWPVIVAFSMVIGGGLCIYGISQNASGVLIEGVGVFLVGVVAGVGGYYLDKKVAFIRSIVTVVTTLRANSQTIDQELNSKIRTINPQATDEECLKVIANAKTYLLNPNDLAPWIKEDVERWGVEGKD